MYQKFLLVFALILGAQVSRSQNNINGKIITKDGSPAPNVNVQINETGKITTSDDKGIFLLKDLPDGTFHVSASFTGLQTQQSIIKLANQQTAILEFVLAENTGQLQEVIINARRTLNNQMVTVGKVPIAPMDLPQSVTVINNTVIRDQQSQRLSDVIKNVNGIYLAGVRASTQENIYGRGYNFSSNNLFKNGARINSGVMPEVSSLERVEVLKGSAAILYGSVAPGGIINMVTKQPKFDFGGELSLRAGSYGLLKPSVDVYGPVSKHLAYRVIGSYEKANSYRDHVRSERYYFNPSLLFSINDRTQLLVQGDYLYHDFTPDFGIGSINDTIVPDLPRSTYLGTNWQYNTSRQSTASATLKHSFNENWTLNTAVSYQVYTRDYYAVERIQAKSNADWYRPLGRIDNKEDYLISNIDLVGKFKTRKISHTLLAGIDADRYYTTSYNFDIQGKIYDTINILDPKKYQPKTDMPLAKKISRVETPVNRAGVYLQDLVSISQKFKLLAGVRWSLQNSLAVKTRYLAKDSVGKGLSSQLDAFSPRVGLVYQPSKAVSIFGSYSNSFSPNSGTDVYGNAMDASIIDQYEAGIKTEAFDGKLSANLTFYKIINNNLAQTALFKADGVTINSNTAVKEMAGQTTSNGVEVDLSSHPVKGLNVMAGYSYNDMRYTKTKPGKGYYIEGERLVNTPQHTANLSAFYSFLEGSLKKLKLGAAAFYVGDRFGGWNNTQPATGEPALKTRLIPVKGFTTVDVSAGYCFKKFILMTKVSNLFNAYNYYAHENYSINPIAPVQFTATLTWKL